MTDRERIDQIAEYWYDAQNTGSDMAAADVLWIIALSRRLLAVEEAARQQATASEGNTLVTLDAALADLDEWRKEQT